VERSVSETLRAYLARRLTEALGPPDRTKSGQMVWVCRYGDEPALVTIDTRGEMALRVLQAPDGPSVDVCAVKLLPVADAAGADLAVAQLSREAGT
jgi:hypothetical protein